MTPKMSRMPGANSATQHVKMPTTACAPAFTAMIAPAFKAHQYMHEQAVSSKNHMSAYAMRKLSQADLTAHSGKHLQIICGLIWLALEPMAVPQGACNAHPGMRQS